MLGWGDRCYIDDRKLKQKPSCLIVTKETKKACFEKGDVVTSKIFCIVQQKPEWWR